MEPMIDHRIAAVAAGLGEFGYSKVFLSRRFGPLQRIGVLLTDAEMEPDPIVVGEICDRCMQCAKACPGKAISMTETTTIEIDGHRIEYGKLDLFKCGLAHHGNIRDTAPYIPDGWDPSDIIREGEEKARQAKTEMDISVAEDWVFEQYYKRYSHPYSSLMHALSGSCGYCGAKGCFRACLAHLEKTGRIESRFHQPFRKPGEVPRDIPAKKTLSGGWRE
jgi:ferredoxin